MFNGHFLRESLDETICMEQQEGYAIEGKEHMVHKLLKYLYDLKQASKAWRKVLHTFFTSMGCQQAASDNSLYLLFVNGEAVYLLVYGDDILIIFRLSKVIANVTSRI